MIDHTPDPMTQEEVDAYLHPIFDNVLAIFIDRYPHISQLEAMQIVTEFIMTEFDCLKDLRPSEYALIHRDPESIYELARTCEVRVKE